MTRHHLDPTGDVATFNVFTDPVRIGTDPDGRAAQVDKALRSTLIVGDPTVATSVLAHHVAAVARDPRVELHVHDLRGIGRWAPLVGIAHTYHTGPDDPNKTTADLRTLTARLNRRLCTLRLMSNGKTCGPVTDRVASIRGYDLHPVVVIVDGLEHLTGHDPARYAIVELLRCGRAAGITIEAASTAPAGMFGPIPGLFQHRWRLTSPHEATSLPDGAIHRPDTATNADLARHCRTLRLHRHALDRLTGQANTHPTTTNPTTGPTK